ncbi:MAG TPA: S1C family serine protease [Oscillospiraceae bacterium]|nr:S1C family serine protease [Oscillospiraceae bacterium]
MKIKQIASLLLVLALLTGLLSAVAAGPDAVTAEPISTQLVIDGRPPELLAYAINDSHYYNVRDLAVMLSGSSKHFDVVWDEEAGTIDLRSDTPYLLVGGELVGDMPTKSASARLFDGTILLDGFGTDFTGYVIGDDLYMRLCDIASAMDFSLTWDKAAGALYVDTSESYCDGIGLVSASDAQLDTVALGEKAVSVVEIVAYDSEGEECGIGSGFFIGGGGQIVTCYHVIEDCDTLTAVTDDGRVYSVGYVLAYDAGRDLAILRAGGILDSVPLALGDSDVLVRGLPLVSISSPYGFFNTMSTGVVSGFREEIGLRDETLTDFQFSTPISRGSSGGPLLDMCGNVLGVTYATYTVGQNLNFGIPINDLSPLLASLRSITFEAFNEEVAAAEKAQQEAEEKSEHPEDQPDGTPITPPSSDSGDEATGLSASLRYA